MNSWLGSSLVALALRRGAPECLITMLRSMPAAAGLLAAPPSSLLARKAAQRPSGPGALWPSRQLHHAAAAASASSSSSSQAPLQQPASLSPSADIELAVRAACERLGRPFAGDVVQALQDNWFSTAGELAALPDDTARSLGVPLRLRATVAELMAGGSADGGSAGGSSQADAAAPAAQRQQGGQADVFDAGSSSSSMDDAQLAEAAAALAAAGQAEAEAGDDFDLPIEERRCPPIRRFGNRHQEVQKVSRRVRAERYALSEEEMSEGLCAEFAAFHRFLTVRFFGAQSEPITEVTARKYADHLRGALGYLHRERGLPLASLSFASLLPCSARDGVALTFDYVMWLHDTRGISVRTEGLVIRSVSAAAKFLFHSESQVQPGRGEKPYSDLGVIKELRAMSSLARKNAKIAPRTADEELKWLSWPEYLEVCRELRRECGALDANGRRRADTAVAWSLQRYLIFAIFSCVPDRQARLRTLRELEVGRTLVKDREGRWTIRHGPDDYKTGRAYGERPPLIIAPHLYPELEAFMTKWRACLQPQHALLFTQPNGQPLSDKSLYKLFWTTSYRLTGKKTNPHLIRDSIVTYLRGGGASERELEALAIYMGHSSDMQRNVYDRRTKDQKVEPAIELLASLNRKAAQAGGSGIL